VRLKPSQDHNGGRKIDATFSCSVIIYNFYMVACVSWICPSITITAIDVDHTGKFLIWKCSQLSVIADLSRKRSPEPLRGIDHYVVEVGVGEIEI